ncbi:hypothetical protein Glove_86g211 [Diversispora epigaea]|uniref:Uncharacterized protein n=1 Tax=Diversispora epigaea TaxID=1348612 RepID=A0A397J6I1_9GLOM|nr:hypothetical protein Glove_86g211 [Diversispora epigaea]
MSTTEEKSTSWSTYFDITPPEDYNFLDYYKHRKAEQTLMAILRAGHLQYCMLGCKDLYCRKEPTQLRKASACCQPYGGLRDRCDCLQQCFSHRHRKFFKDINAFWNQIERRLAENDEFAVLRKQKVAGFDFLKLTEERLERREC